MLAFEGFLDKRHHQVTPHENSMLHDARLMRQSRREHLTELYRYLGVKALTGKIQQDGITHLLPMAMRSDKGILLAEELLV